MERTIIQLKSDFEEFANAHFQVNEFFWGDFLDAISRDAVKYPMMVCTLQPSQIGDSYTGVDLQVIVCDKYSKQDYSMIDEVHSDMYRVLKDVDIALKQFRFQEYLDLETDLSTEPFINRGKDVTAGWAGIFRLRIHDYEDRCAIPQSGFDFEGSTLPSPPTCDDATVEIKDTDNNILYTITAPSGDLLEQIISDGVVSLENSLGTTLDSVNVLAQGTGVLTAPNAAVTNSTGSYNENVPSGGSLTLPDITFVVNVNGTLNQTVTLPSQENNTININA